MDENDEYMLRNPFNPFSLKETIVYRKLIYLTSFTFVLSVALVGATRAELIGWWRLDEGIGTTVADMSGRNHNGQFAEGTPEWVDGKNGKALKFDGANKVEIPDHDDFHLVDAVSVALWAQPEGTQPSYGKFFCKQKSGEYPYAIQYNSSGESIRATVNASARSDTSHTPNFPGEWGHLCMTYDGTAVILYKDGEEVGRNDATGELQQNDLSLSIGGRLDSTQNFAGIIDDVKLYSHALTLDEIMTAMKGEGFPYAFGPDPADGAFYEDTWVNLSWSPGDFAVSHDVYLGESFDDVNDATIESDLFRGNQIATFYIAGFPGFAYPEGLVPGTTYYWRIDEVNDADPESPWKGDVWSFTIPPKTAYNPDPADGAESVDLEPTLSWTPGFGAKMHTVYFGESFDEVDSATEGVSMGKASYSPGSLKMAKTYYWRIDEFDAVATHKGDIWSFTTLGAASGPNPPDGAVGVDPSPILTWTAGGVAASHGVYFGTDADAVASATEVSPEFKATKALGDESYDPGLLSLSTTYYWRIDEVNDPDPDSPWIGKVWSFTTSDFFVVEDFESYTDNDVDGQAIWQHWIDGFGVPDNGSQVGYLLPPYAEQTIVHSGLQSLPLLYNNVDGVTNSEAALTLTSPRDWTQDGVAELSLWFHGVPASVGSFVEGPAGTYTMTAAGVDIWGTADEFHYAFKTLSGIGSISVKVESLQNTDAFAKAGVMIRNSLDPDSAYTALLLTPSNGVRFQYRQIAGDITEREFDDTLVAPYWIKLERDPGSGFRGYTSPDGVNWQQMTLRPSVTMNTDVYIGLALTSHAEGVACEAVFSNVATTGTVSGQWASQDIGIAANAAEPLYVAASNASGAPAVVANDDPAAATINDWTEWRIPLQAFADQGINLRNVDKIAIGLGSKSGMAASGGSGTMYIDDIRLYQTGP